MRKFERLVAALLCLPLGGGVAACQVPGLPGAPPSGRAKLAMQEASAGKAPESALQPSLAASAEAPPVTVTRGTNAALEAMKRNVLLAVGGSAQVEFWGLCVSTNNDDDGCSFTGVQFSGNGTITPLNPVVQKKSWCVSNYTTRFAYRVPDDRYLVLNFVDVGTLTWNNNGNGTGAIAINDVAIQPVRAMSSTSGLSQSAQSVRFYFGPGQLVVFTAGTGLKSSIAGYLADGQFLGVGGASDIAEPK